jgi:hypothetical protein
VTQPYREFSDAELAARLEIRQVDIGGDDAMAWECPSCGHACTAPWPTEGYWVGLAPSSGAEEPGGEWITVPCACEENHPGRPADRAGCGFYADQWFRT